MYSIPIHAVPKPDSDKLRLIVDHSDGAFSLNSMIERERIAGVKLDGIRTLGASLRAFHAKNPGAKLILWKSNVAEAYRNCPMHPLWQAKQVVSVNGEKRIDRCNNFGGLASLKIWISCISLVLWIVTFEYLVEFLKCFVDDHFSFALEGVQQTSADAASQASFLMGRTRDPHEERKQISGPVLTIIGFEVDVNQMTVTMNDDKKTTLIEACLPFTRAGAKKSLREFWNLQGHI
jgi:hypothetical protein